MDVHSIAAAAPANPVEDFLPRDGAMEGGDGVSLEWVSNFVEGCFNGGGLTVPQPPPSSSPTATTATTNPSTKAQAQQRKRKKKMGSMAAQGPPRTRPKRRRISRFSTTHTPSSTNHLHHHTFHVNAVSAMGLMMGHATGQDPPPLLPQAHWLADSELILPLNNKTLTDTPEDKEKEKEKEKMQSEEEKEHGPSEPLALEGPSPRRCTHCLSQKTPQWRAGPLGPRTLCNACGVRFKSGRLLPEYRPAKSPTFEIFKHSNSHKKVLEMRKHTPVN